MCCVREYCRLAYSACRTPSSSSCSKSSSTTRPSRTRSFQFSAARVGRCSNKDQNASNSAAAPSASSDVLRTSNPLSGLFQRPRVRCYPVGGSYRPRPPDGQCPRMLAGRIPPGFPTAWCRVRACPSRRHRRSGAPCCTNMGGSCRFSTDVAPITLDAAYVWLGFDMA